MEAAHLRFAPEILQRLGEELIPHPDLGIIELVRNAYDADATRCEVVLDGVNEAGGRVTIRDDGDGMTADQVRSGWLLLGRSTKSSSKYSRLNRRRVGEKGLGRLGALRLGAIVNLDSHPRNYDGTVTQRVSINIEWRAFDNVEAVEDVALTISTESPVQGTPGTVIVLQKLQSRMLPQDVKRLARSLLLLTGPFPAKNTFRAVLRAPEFAELEKLVRDSYFDDHEFKVLAYIDADGQARASLQNWLGEEVASADHQRLSGGKKRLNAGAYFCPPALFELYHFNLSKAGFDVRNSSHAVSAVQEWLRVVGGMHLFQRGLRVHPYGDPGHDWLDMNLRRVRSPELRPSTNNSIGRVVVEDDEDQLIPKTDRTGFLENEAFTELRRFGMNVLDWAAEEREVIRERERETNRDRTRAQVGDATDQVQRAIRELPEKVRPAVEGALERYQEAVGRQLKSVEDDLLLYRTLSTVGTTTAVFAHETLRPLAAIESITQSLRQRILEDAPAEYPTRYENQLNRVMKFATSMRTFAEIPLRMLSRKKRRRDVLDLNEVTAEITDLFAPYTSAAGVAVELNLSTQAALIRGTVASAEAIIANLLANSVYFVGGSDEARQKRVRVVTRLDRSNVTLIVEDSGPGLVGIDPHDVWLPGRTTRDEGTGLGLTIVRDVARDMGGAVHSESTSELGGARFIIRLPLEQSTGSSVGSK